MKKDGRCISDECLSNTGFSYTLSLINGKYKMTILYTLMEFCVVRFNEIKRYIGGISYKTLSSNLKRAGRGWARTQRRSTLRYLRKWSTV